MSGCYLRRCFKCEQHTRNIEKHLYYVHRVIPLDKRPDRRETPSHGAESFQSQPFELPEAAGGKEVKEEQQLREELLCLETLWVEMEMLQRKWRVQAAIRQSKAVELDMLRNLVVQPMTEYPYAGPPVPGFPRIVSYFGPFQKSVDSTGPKSEEPDSSLKRDRNECVTIFWETPMPKRSVANFCQVGHASGGSSQCEVQRSKTPCHRGKKENNQCVAGRGARSEAGTLSHC
ncbi:hypothetical protein GN956_G4163 [Arapaima gigas]